MWNDSNGEKMKVEVDFSGLDEFLEDAENEIKQGMIEVAHAGVDYSKETGDYQNHTHNLRSAPGSAVVINGEIVDMYVPAEPGHEDAKSKTENLLIFGKRPQNGIIIADFMEDASYVEGKWREVISQGALHIVTEVGKKFSK